jgi:uncharacterized protein (TIGR03067 family)
VVRLGFPRVFAMPPRQTARLLLALFVTGLCATSFADDDAAKNELKRHQGTWIATSSTYDGQKAPEEVVRSIKRIVTDDHVVWERNGKRFAGSKIVLEPAKEPKAIDVIPDGGRNRGEAILGIYRLDQSTLTICMAAPGSPRPSEFKAEKGSGWTLQTFSHEGRL